MGKLINRIPGLRFDMKLLGSASRVCVESLGKPRDSRSILEALPGKIDIKRHSLSILYIPEFFFLCMYIIMTIWTLSQENLTLLHANYKGQGLFQQFWEKPLAKVGKKR